MREVALYVLGDPLLVDNLAEYLDICDRNGLRVVLTSVGLALAGAGADRREVLRRTLSHRVIKQINFSVSGFLANEFLASGFSADGAAANKTVAKKTAIGLEEYLCTLVDFVRSAHSVRSADTMNAARSVYSER